MKIVQKTVYLNWALKVAIFTILISVCAAHRPYYFPYEQPVHSFGGHVVIANRDGNTISFINPTTSNVAKTFTLPDKGEPMYFAYDMLHDFLWVGDRANDRLVILKLRGNQIRVLPRSRGQFLPIGKGVLPHTLSSQANLDATGSPKRLRRQVAFTTADIDNVTFVHDVFSRKQLATIPLPKRVKELGGSPHDVTVKSDGYGFVTYLDTSDDFGYVASYERVRHSYYRKKGEQWKLIKLLRVAKDPHVAVRDNTNLVIAAQGGEVLFASVPDLRILARDDSQPSPHGTFISFDRKYLYITNIGEMGKNAVVTYGMKTGKRKNCPVVNTTNPIPHNPAVTLDGKRLFITHSGMNSTVNSAFDINDDGCPVPSSERVITTGLNPFGLFVIPKPLNRRGW